MSKVRTANLLAALASEIAERLSAAIKDHPSQTDSALAALNLIGFYDGCSNGSLSVALKLSHTATVRLVDKLEASGLVLSRPGEDRRSVSLHLTDAGRARARELLEKRCVTMGDLIDALSSEQCEQLDDIAETLLRKLTTSGEEAGHICRLCDEMACPPDRCPVHTAAMGFQE